MKEVKSSELEHMPIYPLVQTSIYNKGEGLINRIETYVRITRDNNDYLILLITEFISKRVFIDVRGHLKFLQNLDNSVADIINKYKIVPDANDLSFNRKDFQILITNS